MLLTVQNTEQYTCSCLGPSLKSKYEGLEVKSGQLYMIQIHNNRTRKVPVHVKVYKNRYEHYAVISRNQTFSNNSSFVSLKNCAVSRCDIRDNALVIIPDNMEGTKMTFETKALEDIEEWISAFDSIYMCHHRKGAISPSLSPMIPRTPLMPRLEEDDEETSEGN